MRVAQFSKKINTEFTLETFQQYFPIKRHWNERERDSPGRASASETNESSHERTHQAHNDFENRGSKVIYRRVGSSVDFERERERELKKKEGGKNGGKKWDGAREIREIPRNIEGIFPRDVFEISKSYQTGSSPSRNARIATERISRR